MQLQRYSFLEPAKWTLEYRKLDNTRSFIYLTNLAISQHFLAINMQFWIWPRVHKIFNHQTGAWAPSHGYCSVETRPLGMVFAVHEARCLTLPFMDPISRKRGRRLRLKWLPWRTAGQHQNQQKIGALMERGVVFCVESVVQVKPQEMGSDSFTELWCHVVR